MSLLLGIPADVWLWLTAAVLVLATTGYLTRQRTPIVTLDEHVADTDVEVQR